MACVVMPFWLSHRACEPDPAPTSSVSPRQSESALRSSELICSYVWKNSATGQYSVSAMSLSAIPAFSASFFINVTVDSAISAQVSPALVTKLSFTRI